MAFDKTNIEIEYAKTIQKSMNNYHKISTELDKIYLESKARQLARYIADQEDLKIKNINLKVHVMIEVKPIVDN